MSGKTAVKRILLSTLVVWSGLAISLACRADDDDNSTGNGFGSLFRVGGSWGQGVPQDRSLYPIEAFPYILDEESLFYSDLRFFPAVNNLNYISQTTFGGNIGLGYRYYSDSYNRIFGGSLWYDADGTRSVYFQQLGFSLETLGENLDLRSNFYLPVGPLTQQTSLSYIPGSAQFVGDNLAYNQMRTNAVAMKGLDAEAGYSVP
ncbi:MAG: inverse autotransporter beta domain-containing protein, partial [Planctomycetes bacterium]|nr:inverse autotransporter beta domain-containing protein [Planctomycetota bacterium]